MKLKTELEPNPGKGPDWPVDAVFEFDRYGSKIMIWPRQEIWVKECVSGKIIRKEFAIPFRRDKENFYYLERGAAPPAEDFSSSLIPSKWDEE